MKLIENISLPTDIKDRLVSGLGAVYNSDRKESIDVISKKLINTHSHLKKTQSNQFRI